MNPNVVHHCKNSLEMYSLNSPIKGVFSVGGRLSLMVMRNTVIDNRALMPRVTFSPDSDGT